MKKTLLTLSIITGSFYASAQVNPIPNAGFENWTTKGNPPLYSYDAPNGWATIDTLKDLTQGAIVETFVSKSTANHSGQFSVRLDTKKIAVNPAPGQIPDTLPGIITVGQNVFGGFGGGPEFAIKGQPNALTGFYGYSRPTGSNDSAYVLALVFKYDTSAGASSIIGAGVKSFGPTPAGQAVAMIVPIQYNAAEIPDSMSIVIMSSKPDSSFGFTTASPGSYLLIDDLDLTYNTQSISEVKNSFTIRAFPNPATTELSISYGNAPVSTVQVIDIVGKTRQTITTNGVNTAKINTADLASGMYFYKLTDAAGKTLFTNMFTVAK